MKPAGIAWLASLHDPVQALDWSLADWEYALRLARRLRLLGRLAESVSAAGLLDRVPAAARRHLVAEGRQSRFRLRTLSWTVERVSTALASAGYPRVLLKGAAYVAQGLPIAPGRLPSDLDILVPRDALNDAHQRLQVHGWCPVELDAHDQQYYREWSHELPPLRHPQIGMELDLHHGILPPVARTTVDSAALLARLQPSGLPGWQVLAPVDQVLHSAAHLFLDSELRDRVRDLVDLDGLMRHFAARQVFWEDLVARAGELGLVEPLALAVHFTTRWLDTPVPGDVRRQLQARGPGTVSQALLLPLLETVLTPADPDALDTRRRDRAATVLLARHHLHRMPLHLLLPHLWHKARSRRHGQDDGDDGF
ncbi:MAG: nucleotidyltransferase family protein [Rubrivivax sp.]|nr:nucleotidyltransferase family protein [Rubrivivax sp.]